MESEVRRGRRETEGERVARELQELLARLARVSEQISEEMKHAS